MQISKEKVVVLSYQLKLDNGDTVDEATSESPFSFIHGIGQTLPAFDQALEGKSEGDPFEFSLTSEQGYGEYDPSRVQDLDASVFADAPEGALGVGKTLPMQYQDPKNPENLIPVFGTITELTEKVIKMDFNHPLAGKNLNFQGSILEVREATPSELDHGHVHGPGGVTH